MPFYDTAIEAEGVFMFNMPKAGVEIAASIAPLNGGQEARNAAWTGRKGKTLILNADVPDDGEYKAVLFAKNSRYYFDDDQADAARNAAVLKVLRLFEERYSDSILGFNIKAAGDYKGYGEGVVKYPAQYLSYGKTTNTALISPLAGVLRRGEAADFAVTSGDYTTLAVHDGNNLTPMTRDAKTGEFTLHSYVIGDSAETIIVYGSKDGRKYDGLWFYEVVP